MYYRDFSVPYVVEFEDKIIGGKYTLRQALWVSPALFYVLTSIMGISNQMSATNAPLDINKLTVQIIIAMFLFVIGYVAGFIKHSETNTYYDKYIMKKINFSLRRRKVRYYD